MLILLISQTFAKCVQTENIALLQMFLLFHVQQVITQEEV
jgi:hypothetical protein